MIEEREVQDFHDTLKGDVEALAAEANGPMSQLAWDACLAEIVLGYMEESGYASEPVLCPFEETGTRNLCRVIGHSLRDENQTLDLYTSVFLSGCQIASVPRGDISKLTGRAAKFFQYAAAGDHQRFESSPAVAEAARTIADLLPQITAVRVHLLTNGLIKDREIDPIKVADRPVEFFIMDIERLFRSAGRATSRSDIEIDFVKLMGHPLPVLEVLPKPPEYETYLAIFSGDLIYQLYETYGPRLLEFNVRSFLQAKGKVNKGIRDTLRTEPDRFLAYNNGLTATVDEIDVGFFHGQAGIKRIRGLQIVNGGQTTASIHRAKKQDKLDISRVGVAVKVTRVEEEKLLDFIPLISKYSNTQNVIQVSDLSANHAFHIALERLAETVWCPGEEQHWFYERARGGYQVAMNRLGSTPAKRRTFRQTTPPGKKITKTDAAKYIMTWHLRPHDVSRGAQKNFSIMMSELSELVPQAEDPGPEEAFFRQLIAKAIVYKAAERIVRREKFPAYRANIVAYLVSYICLRLGNKLNLNLVWNNQDSSDEFEALLRQWSHEVDRTIRESSAGRNVTEWCKKPECWDEVSTMGLRLPERLPPEFLPPAERAASIPTPEPSQNGAGDYDLQVEQCTAVSAEDWARVVTWGRKTGRLKDIEWKVARTMADYAMEDWEHHPSPKQLKHALRALELAEKAGVVDESQVDQETSEGSRVMA